MRYFFFVALPAIVIARVANTAFWYYFRDYVLGQFAPSYTDNEAAHVGWLGALIGVGFLAGAWAVMHVIYWYFRGRQDRATLSKLRRW